MSATASLIQVTLALMLMVGLILGLAWLAKRFGQPLFQQNKQLRLISSLSLGVKEKLFWWKLKESNWYWGNTATNYGFACNRYSC